MIELLQKSSLCDSLSGKYFYPDDIVFPYSHRSPVEYETENSTVSLHPVQRIEIRDQLQSLLNDSSNKENEPQQPLFESISSPRRGDEESKNVFILFYFLFN